MISVGDILNLRVLKNVPELESYLLWVLGTNLFAKMKKTNALVNSYRVGDNVQASVIEVDGQNISVSQRTAHFVKGMLNMELISRRMGITVTRAAIRNKNCKILVETEKDLSYETLVTIFKELKNNSIILKKYFSEVIFLPIPKKKDMQEQIIEALKPAPIHHIKEIRCFGGGYYEIYVSSQYVGLFIGKNNFNLYTTSKILRVNLTIIGV